MSDVSPSGVVVLKLKDGLLGTHFPESFD